jgi:ABC-2 type transport system permease protein
VNRGYHHTLRRYARLLSLQLRTSFTLAVQYRFDFFIEGVLALLWLGITLVPLMVVFARRATVAGWSYPEFLVSTARFDPWRILDLFGSIAIVVYALRRLHHIPSALETLAGGALFSVAILLIYSLWILVVSLSFRVVKVDNLSYLFMSIFDAGRWPIHVFKGALRVLFTVVFPLALMTTYPAQALLGHLSLAHALLAGAGGLLFAGCARWIWQRSLHAYTSASS